MDFKFLTNLMATWSKIEDVKLGNIGPDTLGHFSKMLGHDLDDSQGSLLAGMLSKEDPELTFGKFITDGGLFRLVTGQAQGDQSGGGATTHITRCPFCNELHAA